MCNHQIEIGAGHENGPRVLRDVLCVSMSSQPRQSIDKDLFKQQYTCQKIIRGAILGFRMGRGGDLAQKHINGIS